MPSLRGKSSKEVFDGLYLHIALLRASARSVAEPTGQPAFTNRPNPPVTQPTELEGMLHLAITAPTAATALNPNTHEGDC